MVGWGGCSPWRMRRRWSWRGRGRQGRRSCGRAGRSGGWCAATGAAWEPASPSGWLVEDTLSARIAPRMALEALVAAVTCAGGRGAARGGGGGAGRPCDGGSGAGGAVGAFGRKVGSGVKGQALSLRFEARDRPQLFVDGLHIVPHVDGTVAVGSTSETSWTVEGTGRAAGGAAGPGGCSGAGAGGGGGGGPLGGGSATGGQPGAAAGGLAGAGGALRRQRGVQDRLRDGPEGGRGDGGPGSGGAGRGARRGSGWRGDWESDHSGQNRCFLCRSVGWAWAFTIWQGLRAA